MLNSQLLRHTFADLLILKQFMVWKTITKRQSPHCCSGLNVCVPSKFPCADSNPNVIIFGGRVFGEVIWS